MNLGSSKAKEIVYLVTTGGTIEKTYDEVHGKLINLESSVENRIISRLRLPHIEVQVKKLLAKDSLDMDDEDRQRLASFLWTLSAEAKPIIVLHGTDTMHRSMLSCSPLAHNLQRPIVFTGAMRPLEMSDSDALQNVIEALMASQLLPPGIFLSFHGKIFSGANFHKNFTTLTFEDRIA